MEYLTIEESWNVANKFTTGDTTTQDAPTTTEEEGEEGRAMHPEVMAQLRQQAEERYGNFDPVCFEPIG